MIRVLLVLAGVVCALWLLRRALRASRPAASMRAPVRTVPCARCGVYLPAAEALVAGDRAYCCAEHRDAGPASGPP